MPTAIKYLNDEDFRQLAAEGKAPDDTAIVKGHTHDIKAINKNARTIDFIVSTEQVDRMGDSIKISGWDLAAFKTNPVVLWSHDKSQPPIGRALSVTKSIKDGVLRSKTEFMSADLNPFADMVFQMLSNGFLKATSVGFMPKEWKMAEDQEERPWGLDFFKQELLEYSVVPIPANPGALMDAKGIGIDTRLMRDWAVKTLDNWTEDSETGLVVPREGIEAIYQDTKDAGNKTYFRVSTEQRDALRKENIARMAAQKAAADALVAETQAFEEAELFENKEGFVVELDADSTVYVLDDDMDVVLSDAGAESVLKDADTTIVEDLMKDDEVIECGTISTKGAAVKDNTQDLEELAELLSKVDNVSELDVKVDNVSELDVKVDNVDETKELADRLAVHLAAIDLLIEDIEDRDLDVESIVGTRSGARLVAGLIDSYTRGAELLTCIFADDTDAGDTNIEASETADKSEESIDVDYLDLLDSDEPVSKTEETQNTDTLDLDMEMVVDTIKDVLTETVNKSVEAALNRARGRVD